MSVCLYSIKQTNKFSSSVGIQIITMVHETKFYDLLEVTPDASDDDLRKSYRKLALKFHPDRNPESGDKFAAISQVRDDLPRK